MASAVMNVKRFFRPTGYKLIGAALIAILPLAVEPAADKILSLAATAQSGTGAEDPAVTLDRMEANFEAIEPHMQQLIAADEALQSVFWSYTVAWWVFSLVFGYCIACLLVAKPQLGKRASAEP